MKIEVISIDEEMISGAIEALIDKRYYPGIFNMAIDIDGVKYFVKSQIWEVSRYD